MLKANEKRLIQKFKERKAFSRDELYEFFKIFEPKLKEGTLGWRIYDLKKKNIIKSVRRGYYAISYKPRFNPEISSTLARLAKTISTKFDGVRFCLWDVNWINEFTQHQFIQKQIIIEIEKDFTESLFFQLKDTFGYTFFLNPDAKTILYYVSESTQPVIIKKLISRSPILKRQEKKTKLYIPQLEKMLVDLFTDNELFYFLQGTELIHVFENAINKYPLNYTKLLAYAKRRDKEKELRQFLKNHLYHLVEEIVV